MAGGKRNRPGKRGLRVQDVSSGSVAWDAGIRAGDVIHSIDGRPVADELDFRFRITGRSSRVGLIRDNASVEIAFAWREDAPIGIQFTDLLADDIHQCSNRCVFCFIHQMPPRMRRSLYVKDDDFRLSFVHGNYVTLTNLTPDELQRIIDQRLSPLYVSVHTVDDALRARLLGRRDPTPIMPILTRLARAGVQIHAQVVLCPGINDGAVLDETVTTLAALHPRASGVRGGVQSIAIVPVGLTKHRDRLPALTAPDRPYADRMVRWLRRLAPGLKRSLGTRFVWLSDEWYYLAGRAAPSRRHYEGFPQLDDGVGTTRLFIDELAHLRRQLPCQAQSPSCGTLITGELAAGVVRSLAEALSSVEGIDLDVLAVRNRWFGGTTSTVGLLTGSDIADALVCRGVKGAVWLPSLCLRETDGTFLDDMRLADLARVTGCAIQVVEPRPRALAHSLGLTRSRRMG